MIEKDVIAVLLRRKNWERYGRQFDTNFFQASSYQSLFRYIEAYYLSAEEEISRIEIDTLRKIVDLRVADDAERAKLYSAISKVYDVDDSQVEVIVREALIRWRAAELLLGAERELANDSLDPALVSKQFDSLAKAIESEEEIEIPPNEDVESLISSVNAQAVYPTGLSELDYELGGGVWEGHLNVALAVLSGGKTFFLSHLAKHSLLNGTPIYGETCEESRSEWVMRIFQGLLELDGNTIRSDPSKSAKLIEALELPKWSIKDRRENGMSIPRIRRDLEKFIKTCEGKKPLVILDQLVYGGIKPTDKRISEPRFQLASVAEELIGIGAEFNVGIWTATQANRAGWGKEVITSLEVAECLDIPRKAHVVISLNQDHDEKSYGSMRLWVDKARERKLHKRLFTVRALEEIQTLGEF